MLIQVVGVSWVFTLISARRFILSGDLAAGKDIALLRSASCQETFTTANVCGWTSSRLNDGSQNGNINVTLIPTACFFDFRHMRWSTFSVWLDDPFVNHSIPEVTPDVNISTWRHTQTFAALYRWMNGLKRAASLYLKRYYTCISA